MQAKKRIYNASNACNEWQRITGQRQEYEGSCKHIEEWYHKTRVVLVLCGALDGGEHQFSWWESVL